MKTETNLLGIKEEIHTKTVGIAARPSHKLHSSLNLYLIFGCLKLNE